MLKATDLRERSVEDLRELEKTLTRDVFQNRFKNFTNRLDDTSAIRKAKKDLARVKTVLTEIARKALGAAIAAAPAAAPVAEAAPAAETPAAEPKKAKKAAAPKKAKAVAEGEAAAAEAKPAKKTTKKTTKSEAK